MQETEKARLEKMGNSKLETDSLRQSEKKRSFWVPSFRRATARERPERRSEREMARSAEEVVLIQKAAAWQWHTRAVGADAVVPTKRPSLRTTPPLSQAVPLRQTGVVHGNALQKSSLKPPTAESRFKAESKFAAPPPTSAGAQPTPPAPSTHPSTPDLYDEFELSGLRTQMTDFVQRLQSHQERKNNEQLQSKPPHMAPDDHPLPVASALTHERHMKVPPTTAAVAISRDHLLTSRTPSPAPFLVRPFSALHNLFRKLIPGPIIKSTSKNSLNFPFPPGVYDEPSDVFSDEEEQVSEYHHHHYVHHHHHHYHYNESPEEMAAIIRSRRRHSDSSNVRPHIPSPWEAESIDKDEGPEKGSPLNAYLARRRRLSDSYATHLTAKYTELDEEEEESVKAGSLPRLPRRYESERFPPSIIPARDRNDAAGRGMREELLDIKDRRANSKVQPEGGKGGGRTYNLSGAGGGPTATKPLMRRRHSEHAQRPKGVEYDTPAVGRLCCRSPSARYRDELQVERRAMVGASPAPRRHFYPYPR